jgi:two-component system, OmpR family, KDP operon response regulator KdpE
MSSRIPLEQEPGAVSDAQILVIEDERPFRQILRAALIHRGFRMTEASTGAAGVRHAIQEYPDVIILDLGLPDMDAIEVVQQIRTSSNVPILITSTCDRTIGAVAALNAGANDYLGKPFETGELLRRIDALYGYANRRFSAFDDDEFIAGGLRVDYSLQRAYVDDREIQLSPAEYGILYSLIGHAGGVVTIEQLREEQSADPGDSGEIQLRTAVAQLRRKIEGSTIPPRFILTEPGVGYRLGVN